MRKEIVEYLNRNPQLHQFLREQPNWYRRLSRNPQDLQQLEISSMHYYKKTFPHQVEKFSNGVQMASMLMSMFQSMNN
ncbi:YlbE-like family protein [Neobacillus sp. LXY-4]|uniref:YlbE-like family protein n=1 Tax=Neobacillus sp. LXY-4 TaxID=3379826 RepID=UPI003EE21456